MKLRKRSWLFIAVGLFLIALASLWTVYSQQSGMKGQLEEELELVRSRLGSIQLEPMADRRGELERELEAASAQSEAARETLSQPMNSIIINDILFRKAEANSVNITEISSALAGKVVLDGVPCLALPLTARVEGEVSHLVDFITEVNGDLPTVIIRTVNMDIPYPAGTRKPSVSLQIVIYSYEES